MLHFVKDNQDCFDFIQSIPVDITISHNRVEPTITHFKVHKNFAHSSTYNGSRYDLTLKTQLEVWLQEICGSSEVGRKHIKPILYTLMKNKGKRIAIFYPEMCISDKGQTELGKFLAIAANFNDIMVYSYSDHIYYAIRIAVKTGFISHNQVIINFITKDDNEIDYKDIVVDEDGGVDTHPKGFLDQYSSNLIKLIGFETIKVHQDGSITNNPDGFFSQYRSNLLNLM